MATKLTKRGKLDNEITYEFVCDTPADLQAIDKQYIVLGSTAIVLEGNVGFEVYMANSQQEWVNIGGGGSNNGGSSEPVWVNQDIIASVPETVSREENGETHYLATNMSLNNHIITGTMTNIYSGSYEGGYMCIQIDPAIIDQVYNVYSQNDELMKEYYVLCYDWPIDDLDSTYQVVDKLIYPADTTLDIEEQHISGVNAIFEISPEISTLFFYKIPGYLVNAILSSNQWVLSTYIFSLLQPVATYDVSQLTYETPQAGE